MRDPISRNEPKLRVTSSGARLEIFDPPMCCSTGMCGPTIDQTLLNVNQILLTLQERGVEVRRYQMSVQPQAFMGNPEVFRLLREQQLSALPITAVDGRVIKTGAYPTLAEVEAALNGGDK
jgi:hypothetical protein